MDSYNWSNALRYHTIGARSDTEFQWHPVMSSSQYQAGPTWGSPVISWRTAAPTASQGLTLVHFSARRKRFVWDRGCIKGLFRGYFRGVLGMLGTISVCLGCVLFQKRLRLSQKSGRV